MARNTARQGRIAPRKRAAYFASIRRDRAAPSADTAARSLQPSCEATRLSTLSLLGCFFVAVLGRRKFAAGRDIFDTTARLRVRGLYEFDTGRNRTVVDQLA